MPGQSLLNRLWNAENVYYGLIRNEPPKQWVARHAAWTLNVRDAYVVMMTLRLAHLTRARQ